MARKILPYNPKLVPLAKKLRKNSTLAEILLWKRLKNGQLLGYDFHLTEIAIGLKGKKILIAKRN